MRRRDAAIGAGLFAFALLVRGLHVWAVCETPSVQFPMVDARAYHERALAILAGDWLGEGVFYQDPLYPYVLAGLYALFGTGSVLVLYAQALLDACTVWLLFALARQLFDRRTAVLAGALAALYGVFLYYDAFLLKVPLTLFLIAAALLLLVRAWESAKPAAWLVAGVVLGLAALTRGNYLLFVPALFVWLALAWPAPLARRATAIALVCLGLGVAILPVTLRNGLVGGDWVLITSQAGQNFFIGNFRGAIGTYRAPPFVRSHPWFEQEDFRVEAERRTGRVMKPSELSRFWFGETRREIARDPARFAALLWRKARLFVNAYEVPDNQSFDFFRLHVAPWLGAPLPSYGALLPLALCGMAFARRDRRALLLVLYGASYAASVILFYNMSRYRVPVVPVVIVFAAAALMELFDRARNKEIRRLWPPLVFLGLAYPVVHQPLIEPDFSIYHFNLAQQHIERGAALRERAVVLSLEGDEAAARRELERSRAQRRLAEAQLRAGLRERPDNAKLRRSLAKLVAVHAIELEREGRLEAALELTRELTREAPEQAEGFARHGALLARLGRLDEAEAALRTALRLEPDHEGARRELARLRRRSQRPQDP